MTRTGVPGTRPLGRVSTRRLVRALLGRLQAAEQELSGAARKLHDEAGQALSAAGLALDLLRLDFAAQNPELRTRLEHIAAMLETAAGSLRSLSFALDPAKVERTGLQCAIEGLVGRHRAGFQGSLELLYDPAVRLAPPVGRAFYKVAELATDNAVRHARCSRIEILVERRPGQAVLEVRDNGRGFDTKQARKHPKGLGFLLARAYARQAGLRLTIRSAPGRGTIVKLVHRDAC